MSERPNAAQILAKKLDQIDQRQQRIEEKIDGTNDQLSQVLSVLEALIPTDDETSDEDRIEQIIQLLQQITTGNRQTQDALDAIDSRLGKIESSSSRRHSGA